MVRSLADRTFQLRLPGVTYVQRHALYAMLVCCEMLGLAVLHHVCWDARQTWYETLAEDPLRQGAAPVLDLDLELKSIGAADVSIE